MVAGDVVRGDDHDTSTSSAANPIFGDRNGLSRPRTGCIDLCIRTSSSDELAELAVSHGQYAEQKPPVEAIGLQLELSTQRRCSPRELPLSGRLMADLSKLLELVESLTSSDPGVIPLELVGKSIQTRESAGENHTRLIAQWLRQHPTVGQALARAGLSVGADQWNACLAECVQPCGDRHLSRRVAGFDELFGDPVLGSEVEAPGPRGEADDLVGRGERREAPCAVCVFDQSCDALIEHPLPETLGYEVDERFAAKQSLHVCAVHEGLLGARKTQSSPRNHDGAFRCERVGSAFFTRRPVG